VQVTQLRLKNFRCFVDETFDFTSRFIIVQGNNGVGKTSLIESLHYACYLKSFRTHQSLDMVSSESDHFFLSVLFAPYDDPEATQEIQIGCAGTKKTIKLNKRAVKSHKEIIDQYRVLSITEDDLDLIKGEPEVRRAFVDQSIFFRNPSYSSVMRQYKKVLQQRNSLLSHAKSLRSLPSELLDEVRIWSQQLWEASIGMQREREEILRALEGEVTAQLAQNFDQEGLSIAFNYQTKNRDPQKNFDEFWSTHQSAHLHGEIALERSLFGAHLDDITIAFNGKKAKIYASRGQQKLVIFLIKFSQYLLGKQSGYNHGILLLDDFLTDFDTARLTTCLKILEKSDLQVLLTCPINAEQIFPVQYRQQSIQL
jgi:DNA replication and repair protein RecF